MPYKKNQERSLDGLKILVIVDKFLTPITNYILNHVVGLLRKGADVRVLASELDSRNDSDLISEHSLIEKTICHSINSKSKVLFGIVAVFIRSLTNRRLLYNLFDILRNSKTKCGVGHLLKSISLLNLVDPSEFNLVHSHSLVKTYEYIYLKKVFDIPVVTTFHGLPTKNLRKLPISKCREVFNYGDLFFVNTLFAKEQLIKLGCDSMKISIIPQSTRVESFNFRGVRSIPDGQLNLISLCRLSYDKGLKYAIEAILQLRERLPFVHYKIIGSGPQENDLRNMIIKFCLQDNITLCGGLGFKEVVELFDWADIFILPSVKAIDNDFHEETQAVVIQEAQASGLPVVATKVGGIPECNIHGKTALLIEDRNSDAITEAILSLKYNNEFYRMLITEGKLYVENRFSLIKIAEKIVKEYLKLCQK